MKYPDLTIITPVYSATEDFLKKIAEAIKSQDYNGKTAHIFINDNTKKPRKINGVKIINNARNIGLTATLNKGFRMAKTEIIVSLMDDCLPLSKDWLKKLVEPIIENKAIAATTSNVEMPLTFWQKFDFFAKAMTEKEQKEYTPGLDEKGCAYRKSMLEEIGYLNEKDFKNGGEDTDLTIRLERSNKWKIAHSRAKVYHLHNTNTKQRLKKEWQYAQLAGLVSRKHFFNETSNFKIGVLLREASFIFFLMSLFFLNQNLILLSSIIAIAIANFRLPFQIIRLPADLRLILLPFFNVFLYVLYILGFSYALLFKPRV